ncbi:HlyD family efflux transporter periplasmic adaptor subunit [Enterobacteriaceae bacterium H11S18]|uniref:efflux RND transporter periplasmic adaptor subunit n=1 Tax=Dryocola clanedunensis TaxID=2925396 RepID=UPI0022EFEA58|nr:HlyD family efflux transporter periplasmic adaptor subunit [Dryocola clanedunensis]MCT4708829.1 HlyD family efflux transporter periplasmic adaptor subunit [Dryocola clanedunensis]
MTKFNSIIASVRRRPFLLTTLMLPMVVTIVLLFFREPERKESAMEQQTEWLAVHPQRLTQQLGLVGRVRAARQETLSAPFEGVIYNVAVHQGESVKEGQVLAELDPELIEIKLRQAKAELLKAQREVHRFHTWSDSPEVSRARRAERLAKSTLETTQANLHDTRALFNRGIVARMEVDALIQQVRTQKLDLLTAGEDLRTVEARGQGEDRKIAEMELVNAQVRYQALTTQSKNLELRAPFTGVVIRPVVSDGGKAVFARSGLQVSKGTPLLTVIGLDRIQILTQVDESDLNLLREGLPVQATGDGFSGQVLTGHISAIAVQSDSSAPPGSAAHYDVVVSVDTPSTATSRPIRLGMSARVAVSLYRNEKGIAVPPQALQTDNRGETWVVYRATPDSPPSRCRVKPGKAVSQGIEIEGIQAGYIQVPVQ